jgi:hypothetical protein
MNRFVLLAGAWLVAGTTAFGQDAAAIAARQEAAERDRLFSSQLDELRQTVIRQQRDINRLANENSDLQRQIKESERRFRESMGNAITQRQLEDVVKQLKEVDDKRVADNKLIVEQIKKVAEIAAKAPPVIVTPQPPPATNHAEQKPDRTTKPKDSEPDEGPALVNPDGYYTYKIKSGDRLLGIIAAYNDALKDKNKGKITLDQVKKANPKVNPNNLPVGREILIPIPPDK